MNAAVTRQASAQPRLRGVAVDADQIIRMLPHRPPFLFLDRVIELDPPVRAVGLKNVTINEPWFAGHFPGQATLPGVLLAGARAGAPGWWWPPLRTASPMTTPTATAAKPPPPRTRR